MTESGNYNRQKVLDYIVEYKKAHDGNSPTYREIMNNCGLSSLSHVQFILIKLDEQGLILLDEANKRTIEVVGGQWIYQKEVICPS